jgi:hypothetical protein
LRGGVRGKAAQKFRETTSGADKMLRRSPFELALETVTPPTTEPAPFVLDDDMRAITGLTLARAIEIIQLAAEVLQRGGRLFHLNDITGVHRSKRQAIPESDRSLSTWEPDNVLQVFYKAYSTIKLDSSAHGSVTLSGANKAAMSSDVLTKLTQDLLSRLAVEVLKWKETSNPLDWAKPDAIETIFVCNDAMRSLIAMQTSRKYEGPLLGLYSDARGNAIAVQSPLMGISIVSTGTTAETASKAAALGVVELPTAPHDVVELRLPAPGVRVERAIDMDTVRETVADVRALAFRYVAALSMRELIAAVGARPGQANVVVNATRRLRDLARDVAEHADSVMGDAVRRALNNDDGDLRAPTVNRARAVRAFERVTRTTRAIEALAALLSTGVDAAINEIVIAFGDVAAPAVVPNNLIGLISVAGGTHVERTAAVQALMLVYGAHARFDRALVLMADAPTADRERLRDLLLSDSAGTTAAQTQSVAAVLVHTLDVAECMRNDAGGMGIPVHVLVPLAVESWPGIGVTRPVTVLTTVNADFDTSKNVYGEYNYVASMYGYARVSASDVRPLPGLVGAAVAAAGFRAVASDAFVAAVSALSHHDARIPAGPMRAAMAAEIAAAGIALTGAGGRLGNEAFGAAFAAQAELLAGNGAYALAHAACVAATLGGQRVLLAIGELPRRVATASALGLFGPDVGVNLTAAVLDAAAAPTPLPGVRDSGVSMAGLPIAPYLAQAALVMFCAPAQYSLTRPLTPNDLVGLSVEGRFMA